MTGRHKLIERLMTEFFREPEDPIPDYERSGIIVAGVKITNPEAKGWIFIACDEHANAPAKE